MNNFHVLFVTVKSLNLLFGNRDKDNISSVKGSNKDKTETVFTKSDIYDFLLTKSCVGSSTNSYTVH